ncbi:MAG: hypothetical protein CSB15_00455 [Clostridiales bacterium]|nr:MAG: hypothetical protein CSB15_00455 [Clostridiales bacterium]
MDNMINNRYKLIESIGSGGMNDIYKAIDLETNELVALKILKKEFVNDSDIVTRFHTEAEAIQKLDHENIVKVLGVGSDNQIHYIVMELLETQTLKDYIKSKDVYLKNEEIINISLQILYALKYAHDAGIIHRDIKPQNILSAGNGVYKVSDFGIASFNNGNTIVHKREAMGSLHYASPEQINQGVIDKRTDIYSFGIVLYELVTGLVPFDAQTPAAILKKHDRAECVKAKYINFGVNGSIDKIITKAISKAPINRFDNVDVIIELFEELKQNPKKELEGALAQKLEIVDKTVYLYSLATNVVESPLDFPVDNRHEFDSKIFDSRVIEEKEEDDEKSSILPILIAIFGGLLIGVILLFLFYNSVFPKSEPKKVVEKPAVEMVMDEIVGMTLSEANELLKNKKVTIEKTDEKFSDKYEKDIIISQIPEKGVALKEGQIVKVVLSKGIQMVKIPSFVGLSFEDASEQAKSLNLSVEAEKKFKVGSEPGKIIDQSPSEGEEVKKGTKVTLIVSIGKDSSKVVMPDLVNKKRSEAIETLRNMKLVVGRLQTRNDSEVDKDRIIMQSVPIGKEVAEGTVVDLIISLGKKDLEPEEPKEPKDPKETPAEKPATEPKPTKSKKSYFIPLKQDGKKHVIKIVKVVNGKEVEFFKKTYSDNKPNVKIDLLGSGVVKLKFYVDDRLADEKTENFDKQ